MLDEGMATANQFKQASAVITLLKEAADLESPATSRMVALVKKGCLKRAATRKMDSKRMVKSVMRSSI